MPRKPAKTKTLEEKLLEVQKKKEYNRAYYQNVRKKRDEEKKKANPVAKSNP